MTKTILSGMLYTRQRTLLGVIKQLNAVGIASRTYLMKTLFLLKQNELDIGYDFYPYNYGPFSKTVFWDLNYLKQETLIDGGEREITSKGEKEAKINEETVEKVNQIIKQFKNKKEITRYVYDKYPEFTEKSVLLGHEKINETGKYTIGYEKKSIDFFMNQIIQNKITKLIDVRKNAFSMKRGFSKSVLKKTLEDAGIKYEHISELGIESDKRQKLETKEDYEKLFKEYRKTLPKKQNELNYVNKAGENERIAIMCFEKDPSYCHRGQISDFVGGFEHL